MQEDDDKYPEELLNSTKKKFISQLKDAIEERKEIIRCRIIGGYYILGAIIFSLILLVILYISSHGF